MPSAKELHDAIKGWEQLNSKQSLKRFLKKKKRFPYLTKEMLQQLIKN